MEQEGCIYLITCLVNGKKYVGQYRKPDPKGRWAAHLRNATKGASTILHNAIRLYGKENFKIDTLCVCSHTALGNMEAYYAEQYGSYIWDPEPGYNMVWCGNQPMLGIKHTPETIKKIKQTLFNNPMSSEHIEKIRQSLLGKKRSLEICKKIKQTKLNNPMSLESRDKIRQVRLGKKQSPEHIEKIRQTKLGKKHTPEACEKMRQAQLLRRKKEQSQK